MSSNLIRLFSDVSDKEVCEQFNSDGVTTISGGGNFSSKAFFLSQIINSKKDAHKILWIVSNYQERDQVILAMRMWSGFHVEPLVLERNETRNDDIERLNKIKTTAFLSKALSKQNNVFVIEYTDALQFYPKPEDLEMGVVKVSTGQKTDAVAFFNSLIAAGYEVSGDKFITKGQYYRSGDLITIFPVNTDLPVVINIGFDTVDKVCFYNQETGTNMADVDSVSIYPVACALNSVSIFDYFGKGSVIVDDDVEVPDIDMPKYEEFLKKADHQAFRVNFTSFMEESSYHHHLHYLSVLKYQNILDFISDVKEKITTEWKILLFTKNTDEYTGVFEDKTVKYETISGEKPLTPFRVNIIHVKKDDVFPIAFQNPKLKVFVVTDREVIDLNEKKKADDAKYRVFSDFLTGLKVNDYVVHTDHGIGIFMGLYKMTVDGVTREYLKIGYAENDKLFVPIDQADRVSKFIGSADQPPRLTRLGSAEWDTITEKVKKETEKIAKELLDLYARRESAKGFAFSGDDKLLEKFSETFPYEETPGQLRAISDVLSDMEKDKPMDRLVCGDVGFGKTEVAMRAAFKAVMSGKQVALISPITILTDQHYKSFKRRMDDFHIRIEMLSRFRSQAEQKKILKGLKDGTVDVVIGTHRLLQSDIEFKNLGLVIVDEEQRFGVKQKEALKSLRTEVDILTLTATPIPRTLNISLHGLRDITTITTPPPGRQPIITEVRRFSYNLIRNSILLEAMKDLEIRGAGDILGANQHGSINIVGVSHFVRMLNQAVEELKSGGSVKAEEKPIEVSIELPIPALIPDDYIANFKDKINVYQKLASADNFKFLSELRAEIEEDFGAIPNEVGNLFRILELKLLAKAANLTNVKAENVHSDVDRQIILTMSDKVKPENIMNMLEYNPKWIISGTKLKCKFNDLGVHWVDELAECLKKLHGKVERGKWIRE